VPRFVLYYRQPSVPRRVATERLKSVVELAVLEEGPRGLLLVEADEMELRRAIEAMPGWTMSPERSIEPPGRH
jgi:hypothetical protein